MSTTKNLLPVLIALVLVSVIGYAVITQIAFDNDGAVDVTLEVMVYFDLESTSEVTEINWGTFAPGETKEQVIYLNSTSNIPVDMILSTSEWSTTEAEGYLTLTWNLTDTTIEPDEVIVAKLMLAVDEDAGLTSFPFTFVTNIDIVED